MANKTTIQLYKDKRDEFYFKKIAGNGEDITMSSESYIEKRNAYRAIATDALIVLDNLYDDFGEKPVTNQLEFPIHIEVIDKTEFPVKLMKLEISGDREASVSVIKEL